METIQLQTFNFNFKNGISKYLKLTAANGKIKRKAKMGLSSKTPN
jgi:hypothetical protein